MTSKCDKNDNDFNNESSGKEDIYDLFLYIKKVMINNELSEDDIEFQEFADSHLLYNDASEEHLPIPVFSYVRPTMGTQFILHILLSVGRYSTEIDLLKHSTLRESFRYAKLIGSREDDDSLEMYASEVFLIFIVEQLIYYPNSRFLIDSWIITSAQLFNDIILYNLIPITDMPPVQQTTSMRLRDEKCENFVKNSKKKL